MIEPESAVSRVKAHIDKRREATTEQVAVALKMDIASASNALSNLKQSGHITSRRVRKYSDSLVRVMWLAEAPLPFFHLVRPEARAFIDSLADNARLQEIMSR